MNNDCSARDIQLYRSNEIYWIGQLTSFLDRCGLSGNRSVPFLTLAEFYRRSVVTVERAHNKFYRSRWTLTFISIVVAASCSVLREEERNRIIHYIWPSSLLVCIRFEEYTYICEIFTYSIYSRVCIILQHTFVASPTETRGIFMQIPSLLTTL